MTPAAFEQAALALPGATVSVQWGADRVYKVGGKMFAVRGDNSGVRPPVSFKVSDLSFEMLTKKKGVAPAPYLARAKWVMLEHLRVLPDDEIRARLAEAHRLVAEKLPKTVRESLIPA
ncbi:MAG: MmcQ/YjbR family DNA-binding protein [Alphaproteobacteria bacterium]|nr:MmcQ/YjbR family DNA-binding protein [Alphaproteobacteria bacterium]